MTESSARSEFPRPLRGDETRILHKLLAQEFTGAAGLRDHVPFATAAKPCECGCPTVDIMVDQAAVAPAIGVPRSPIPVEAHVVGDDGEAVAGIIVFVKDGYLSMLEMYSMSHMPGGWPPPELLRIFVLS